MDIESPPPYEDVNEAAVSDWKQSTTTRERIRAVIQRVQEPTPASAIADRARASKPVVRDTLADLADLGVVETLETGQGTLYREIVELTETYEQDELVANLQEIKETVNGLRAKHDAESPAELAQTLDPDDSAGWEDHTKWQTAQKNLYLVKAAISWSRRKAV
jgi:DNA-binding transcriptional ArsR family regulator